MLKSVIIIKDTEMFLVTADVSSLYMFIQHNDTLLALNWQLPIQQIYNIPYIQKKIPEDGFRLLLNTQLFLVRRKFL